MACHFGATAVLLALGCSGDDRATPSTMGGSTGNTTGDSCYDRGSWENCGYAEPPRPGALRPRGSGGFTCGTPPSSCDSVTGPQDTWSPEATAALECILKGFRDRVPAVYAWRSYENYGQYDITYSVELLSNETMIWSESGDRDLVCGWSESLRTAPPKAPIDDCLASQDPNTYWWCLGQLLDGTECVGPAECP